VLNLLSIFLYLLFLEIAMTDQSVSLSVIIPLAANEEAWRDLLDDLRTLPIATQIIFVMPDGAQPVHREELSLPQKDVVLLSHSAGRAEQMNAGAQVATGTFLWFLHADSQFSSSVSEALQQAMVAHPDSLLYFDLAFLKDASLLMNLNNWGVRFRSRVLQVPFGDQGLCLRRTLFHSLGGYPEGLPYGEDHVFVWRVRQRGLTLQPVAATLYTSARKYRENGWVKTTLRHQILWFKQAWPEWKKLRLRAKS
jgi:rSAM/selenodomain-associated transferase 2